MTDSTTRMNKPEAPVLVEVVRSGFVESQHRGHLVVLGIDGSIERAVGDVSQIILPRSSSKPLQTVGMLNSGLSLPDEQLAIVAASHSGESFHIRDVQKILMSAGLTEENLGTPPSLPLDDVARIELQSQGHAPHPIYSDCSGKHAGMLATCVINHWPLENYLDPQHPLQQAIRTSIEQLTGETVKVDATDGCGAPLYGISLMGLARGMQACVQAPPGSNRARVVGAMRAFPLLVAGTHCFDTKVMQCVPGLIAKTGVEGVHVAALEDGRTLAFKVEDGSSRAVRVILTALLKRIGMNSAQLNKLAVISLTGGRAIVGAIRASEW